MASTSSFQSQVVEIDCGSHVIFAAPLGAAAAFALADGSVAFVDESGALRRASAHENGAILTAAADGRRLVTGGDDGLIVAVDAGGVRQELADEAGQWIDAVAARSDGSVAWSVGKQVRAIDRAGQRKSFSASSSVRGLAFLPKGYRLALTGYNGVTLWFPNVAAPQEVLEWRGSHLNVTVSPDGRFVVSSMQENALHGWRVADRKNMRMTGYPGKTRSFSWSADGEWLATSGAEACIVWPFVDKDGPMGKPPRECGVRAARVSQVAFHPKERLAAVGYDDGWILLCRLGEAEEAAVRAPSADSRKSAITALAWSASGERLSYGTADGVIGLASIPNRS
jgi:WD40 repeat protein